MSLYKRGESWRYNFTVDGKRYMATIGKMSKTRADEIYQKAKIAARKRKTLCLTKSPRST